MKVKVIVRIPEHRDRYGTGSRIERVERVREYILVENTVYRAFDFIVPFNIETVVVFHILVIGECPLQIVIHESVVSGFAVVVGLIGTDVGIAHGLARYPCHVSACVNKADPSVGVGETAHHEAKLIGIIKCHEMAAVILGEVPRLKPGHLRIDERISMSDIRSLFEIAV